jgi:hypothetical protein
MLLGRALFEGHMFKNMGFMEGSYFSKYGIYGYQKTKNFMKISKIP